MADAIHFTDMGGVVVLLVMATIYLGSSYLHQKEK